MAEAPRDASPVLDDLDVLVDFLEGAQARVASAYAAEVHFFAGVANLVQRREQERAQREDHGAVVSTSQLAMREIYAEIGAALRLSEYQVAVRVNRAHTLMTRFLETMCEVSDGRLSPQHAQAIADAGADVGDATVRQEYERLALDLATELTPAQLKDALDGVVNRLDPAGTQERIRQAVAERSVRKRAVAPGLGRLVITAPITEIEGSYNRLVDIATEIQTDNAIEAAEHASTAVSGKGGSSADGDAAADSDMAANGDGESEFVADERSRAQIMADVALDLLLTSAPEGHGATDERRAQLGDILATVHITIPASTLAGTAFGGAEIAGAGAIDDETARRLAGGSDVWYRLFVDPTTGVPVSVDKRRPCTAQKRLLRARDERCRFPGCRRPARDCDVDHQIAWKDGGPTDLGNLAHLCERHHTVKHHTDWEVEHLPGGVLRWTSPTRRIHSTRPPGAVRFVPDRPPGAPAGHAPRTPAEHTCERESGPAPF